MTREPDLAYWMMAREDIRIRKEAGIAPPWSYDKNLAEVRYCNVRREDDKVTRYLAKEWRPQAETWQIVLARMINFIPSLSDIRPMWHDPIGMKIILKAERDVGYKIFTSAYTISTAGAKMDKLDYVFDVVQAVQRRGEPDWGSMSLNDAHQWLMHTSGLGSFLAAQVVADLKNTQGHGLQHAPDWQTWAAHGPGSLKGLSAFWNRAITPGTFGMALDGAWELTRPLLREELHDLHMQDFQNCMCEFSKYIRIKEGDGRARNKYHPG